MLVITPDHVMLDWIPVNLVSLDTALRDKQDLYRSLGGGPKNEIFVQVTPGVSEERIAPFLATARAAGFVNVTRSGYRR